MVCGQNYHMHQVRCHQRCPVVTRGHESNKVSMVVVVGDHGDKIVLSLTQNHRLEMYFVHRLCYIKMHIGINMRNQSYWRETNYNVKVSWVTTKWCHHYTCSETCSLSWIGIGFLGDVKNISIYLNKIYGSSILRGLGSHQGSHFPQRFLTTNIISWTFKSCTYIYMPHSVGKVIGQLKFSCHQPKITARGALHITEPMILEIMWCRDRTMRSILCIGAQLSTTLEKSMWPSIWTPTPSINGASWPTTFWGKSCLSFKSTRNQPCI